MATIPPSICAACHAPLAPGAKFCGVCGRASAAGPVPPSPSPPPPPRPPAPPPPWTGQGGIDTLIFAGPAEQALPRVAAALAQAGAQPLGQTLGGVRFQHGGAGARMTGEVALRPDGHGDTAVSATLQVDQGNFMLTWGASALIGLVMALIVFQELYWIVILIVGAIVGFSYMRLSSERPKVLERVMASLRQAAAAPPAGYAPPPQGAYAAPPPPAPAAASPAERLRQFAAQRDAGTITSEEFERLKAAILAQLN